MKWGIIMIIPLDSALHVSRAFVKAVLDSWSAFRASKSVINLAESNSPVAVI
jgi:hypothetical protein